MITVAGSGPSSKGYSKKVTIATKKIPCDSEYIYIPHVHFYHGFSKDNKRKPLLARREFCTCKKCRDCEAPVVEYLRMKEWWDYYAQFNPKNRKPSIGTEAIWFAIQLWQPKTIGVIGLDGLLDGQDIHAINPHDAPKERLAILSLVNLLDLRNDSLIHRIRPPRGVRLPRFLPKCYREGFTAGDVHTSPPGDVERL